MRLIQGRNFSKEYSSDSAQSVIVNETLAKIAGLNNPIGRPITMIHGSGNSQTKTIVGVVKDYHYTSLKEKIGPIAFVLDQSETLWIKLSKEHIPEALSTVQREFKTAFPEYFYSYTFVEDENKAQYESDQRWKQIITYGSVLSVLICCIGLFGIAHYSTIKRVKEIGIRKVLGASITNISWLLSKEFLKLVLLSIIIASPIAWFIVNIWLQSFSYRIQISWIDFMVAASIGLLISLITVNLQTFNAAIANPVNSLRAE